MGYVVTGRDAALGFGAEAKIRVNLSRAGCVTAMVALPAGVDDRNPWPRVLW